MENTIKWLKNEEIMTLSEMLKALAHPSRISIMYVLCNNIDKRMTVKCIYETLKMSQPVISRHLGILKNAGLVSRLIKGPKIFYELNTANPRVKHISACFTAQKMK